MKTTKRKNGKTFSTNNVPEAKNKHLDGKGNNKKPARSSMTWAVNDVTTKDIYKEMGVSELVDDSVDNSPTTYSNDTIPQPQAPKGVGTKRPCTTQEKSEETPVKWVPPHSEGDGCFICKRPRRENIEGDNSWNKFSDEIILTIFSWLPKAVLVKCGQVCRRWNRLTFDESLWKRLDVGNTPLAPGVLGRIFSRGVVVLRAAKAEIHSPIHLDFQASFWKDRSFKVQYLDFSMATISVTTLESVFEHCRSLKKISLENCEVSTTVLESIGHNKDLEVLNLCMCKGITIDGILNVIKCRKLQELNLSWTSLTKECIVYTCLCLPRGLSKLSLNGFREALSDDDVLQLVKKCPNLTELDLSDSTLLTETSVEHIVNHLKGLEHISLSRCYNISPTSFHSLTKIVTLLAAEIFGMLRDNTLADIKESMSNIEINMYPFCSVARPTTGIRRTSVWGLRVRDKNV